MLGVNPNNSEWYTPRHLLERVYSIMDVDLDPCSPPVPTVRCKQFYTVREDGLSKNWYGNIFLNPPYGREISRWVDKLVSSFVSGNVTNAICLVPCKSDTKWFSLLAGYCQYFVTLYGRVRYVSPAGEARSSGTFPSCVFLLSNDLGVMERFSFNFYDLGMVWRSYFET